MSARLAPMALAVAIALAAPRAATGNALLHVARAGDTAEALAAEYYGNRALAFYIREVNHLPRGARLRRGQQVRVPTSFRVRLKPGETLEALAKRFLDDARRAPFLAAWSGLRDAAHAPDGADVLVPYQWTYRATGGEALSAVAKMFYNDPSQGKMLADYNFRAPAPLRRGELLAVPLPNLRVRSVYLAAPAKARSSPSARELPVAAPPRDAQRREAELANRVADRLRDAEKAYRDGNYDDVPALLTKLLSEEDPSEAQLIAIHRLLAFAYVALGADAVAVKEFRELLERQPDATLDAATVSPKIRAAFERAKQER